MVLSEGYDEMDVTIAWRVWSVMCLTSGMSPGSQLCCCAYILTVSVSPVV